MSLWDRKWEQWQQKPSVKNNWGRILSISPSVSCFFLFPCCFFPLFSPSLQIRLHTITTSSCLCGSEVTHLQLQDESMFVCSHFMLFEEKLTLALFYAFIWRRKTFFSQKKWSHLLCRLRQACMIIHWPNAAPRLITAKCFHQQEENLLWIRFLAFKMLIYFWGYFLFFFNKSHEKTKPQMFLPSEKLLFL